MSFKRSIASLLNRKPSRQTELGTCAEQRGERLAALLHPRVDTAEVLDILAIMESWRRGLKAKWKEGSFV